MKIHRLLVEAVAHALTDIFQNGKYADKVIERLLKSNPKWGSRDRAFIAETTYECVRWWRLLHHLVGHDVPQITDLETIIGAYLALKFDRNFPEFPQIDLETLQKKRAAITARKIKESMPDWLDATGEAELGSAAWAAEATALNQSAPLVLRCNALKTTVSALKKRLETLGITAETSPLSKDALVLTKRTNVFSTEPFKEGLFEVQDAGSQLIAPFLEVEPSMRVVDACAGAGGKSLHLATLMGNKGRIIAMDTEGWKLEELKKRARRNGVHIVETRVIDSTKVIKRLHDSADRLLLDVPCSGLGVLRRNPDAKWKLQPSFLDDIRATQRDILANYAKMLRVGGKMVYATCSILPSENERQIDDFLSKNAGFKLLKDRKVLPSVDGFDGFYMALLERVS